jgi:uroporphyrinogen decarboxylase
MTDLMMGADDDINLLLDYCTGVTSGFIKLMAQTGCDMVSNGDSSAGPEMISRELYVKYALPSEKIITEQAHLQGFPYHICGNTDAILEHMLKTGADAFELDYKTDINKIYNTISKTTTFIGNIDPSGVLALGTLKDVKTKTEELLSVYKNSNRFILNAGCAIPPNTPPENLKMMIETARNFFNIQYNMNGYQRITAALRGENRQTPVMLHNFLMAAREHGVTMDQYRNNPK